jgi:hypothetical protein
MALERYEDVDVAHIPSVHAQLILQRFLITSVDFSPLDMSPEAITDTYAQIAAALFND